VLRVLEVAFRDQVERSNSTYVALDVELLHVTREYVEAYD